MPHSGLPPSSQPPPPIDQGGSAAVYGSGPVEQRTIPARPGPGVPAAFREPSGGKIQRISSETRGLFQDVTEWIELRLQLAKAEVKEEVSSRLSDVKKLAVAAALAALAGIFLLVALAVGLGALGIALGLSSPLSYFLGFLIVSLVLGGLAAIFGQSAAEDRAAHLEVAASAPERQAPGTGETNRPRLTNSDQ